MKRLLWVAAVGLLGMLSASAQTGGNSTTQFTSPNNVDSQLTKQIPGGQRPLNATGRFAPRPSGAFYELYKKGPMMISPLAPADYGRGEHFIAANPQAPTPVPSAELHNQDAPFGGIKLFGWDF